MRRMTILAASVLLLATNLSAERTLVEGIVVRVNDRILTTRDIARRIDERAAEMGHPLNAEEIQGLTREAVDDLCLLERAAELKMEVDDQEVDSALTRLREQNQVKDDKDFEVILKSMGLTRDQLRARVSENIIINRLMSKEVPRPTVTEEELKQRYAREPERYRIPEKVQLEHIILSVGTADGEEERVLADARRLVAAARASGSFLTLVKEETDAGRGTGGDLGSVAVQDLRPEVAAAVKTLKAGEIAEPFRTPSGVHVVRLVERFATTLKPFSDVVEELRYREEDERYRSHITGIVDGLKKRYVVEIHPELVPLPTAKAR
jgi:peptidyl-prolyl cis-trans isomerase SurA